MSVPIKRNVIPATISAIVISIFFFAMEYEICFLKKPNLLPKSDLSMKYARINSGKTMPSTYMSAYMPPQNIEPGNIDNANTPANTGAQQRAAKAEKIPKTKTEPAPCTFIFGCEKDNEKWSPRSIDMPRNNRKMPPDTKIKLWY